MLCFLDFVYGIIADAHDAILKMYDFILYDHHAFSKLFKTEKDNQKTNKTLFFFVNSDKL